MDNFEILYRSGMMSKQTINGTPPLTFTSDGSPLSDYTIYGYTSPNLFDVSAASADSAIDRDTGEIVESSGSLVSDWIAYDSEKSLFISGRRTIPAVASIIFAFYDSEKNYIDWVGVAFSSGQHSYEVTEIPDSAAFFRVQFFDDGFSNVMINQGETALPYEPFGGVGVRTENLFDYKDTYIKNRSYKMDSTLQSSQYFDIYMIPITGDTTYTVFGNNNNSAKDYHCFFDSNNNFLLSFRASDSIQTATSPANARYIGISVIKTKYQQVMLTEGSFTPPEYIPYGYKIPITCGGTTTPIYIGDTPLGTGQTVTGSETGVAIPTVDGQNTLSVETTVQPSKVVISAASGMSESVKKYFDYKYGVLKMAGIKE